MNEITEPAMDVLLSGTQEIIELCSGHAVADATCALARALHGYGTGSRRPEEKDFAIDQLVRLQNLYTRARAAGFSFERFGQAARHNGTIILRERLGADASHEALREMICGR